MIRVYPAADRFLMDLGWVRNRPSFSFGAYFDPQNTQFGVMRVCNDDEISPDRGFGPHPHSDMEVVTVVLQGRIKHEDNLGNAVETAAGEVQRMTAGTGIIHAETNPSSSEWLHSLQLWFMPEERGLEPSFESRRYPADKLVNALLPVVTREGSEHAARIHQDMTLYLSRLDRGRTLVFRQEAGRRSFLFVIEGRLSVNGIPMGERDTARVEVDPELNIAAERAAFFMLIDLP